MIVECGVVEPCPEIHDRAGVLVHALHEQLDVLGDDGFLFLQGLVGEGGGYHSAVSGVLLTIRLP